MSATLPLSQRARFPRSLLGDAKSTASALRRIVKHAWSQRDWAAALAEEDMVDLSEMARQPIYLDVSEYDLPKSEVAWRLHDLNPAALAAFRSGADRSDLVGQTLFDLHHDIIISGMRFLWFTLAKLNPSAPNAWLLGSNRSLSEAKLAEFEKYVEWLPEIVRIVPQLRLGFNSSQVEQACGIPAWAICIVGAVRAATGCPVQGRIVLDRYHGDLIRYLLDEGFVSPQGERYIVGPRIGRARSG